MFAFFWVNVWIHNRSSGMLNLDGSDMGQNRTQETVKKGSKNGSNQG